jgi:hypothetical protein
MRALVFQNGDSVAAWMSAPDQTIPKASESPLQARSLLPNEPWRET